MLLCAVFIRISVRFCDIRTPPLPPYTIYSFQKCCGIKDVFQCNSNNLYKHAVLRLFRLSLTFFFSFFAKRELITEAGKQSCATYNLWLLKKIISFNKCHYQPFCSFLGNCSWKQVLAVLAHLTAQSRLESNANPSSRVCTTVTNSYNSALCLFQQSLIHAKSQCTAMLWRV